MRRIIVLTFMTLDGVMQAPGGPQEDTRGGFSYGGWSVPYWDDVLANEMNRQMGGDFELLLGRRTYDIFHASWPVMEPDNPINRVTKYVVSTRELPSQTDIWKNSVLINTDVAARLKEIKEGEGPDLQVHGSGELIQTLLSHDLVDEFWLKIYPVVLGTGRKLFGEGTRPAAFDLISSATSPGGVILARYRRAGKVRLGSFGSEEGER